MIPRYCKLAIVGSTTMSDEQFETAKYVIEGFICGVPPIEIITGGAMGIDSIAIDTWFRMGGTRDEIREFLPEHPSWNGSGTLRGYKHRNKEIAEACDALLRIVRRDTETYGSGWTADRARELGKPVREVYL